MASSFFSAHDGNHVIHTGYAVERWVGWLEQSIRVAKAVGGEGSMHVEIGLDGISGTRWPSSSWGRNDVEALEEGMRHDFVLAVGSSDEIHAAVEQAFVKVTHAYGLAPFTETEFEALLGGR